MKYCRHSLEGLTPISALRITGQNLAEVQSLKLSETRKLYRIQETLVLRSLTFWKLHYI